MAGDKNAEADSPDNPDTPTPTPSLQATDGFPIEGDSKWVTIMRVMAAGIFMSLIVIGAVFHFLTGGDSFIESQQLAMIMGGIVFLLVLEYFVFFLVVIPRQADYGRYAIHREKVEYYPLTALGLGISERSQSVHIGRFMGIATGRVAEKKGRASYGVYLIHSSEKGKTINVKSFPTLGEAESYAAELGRKLRLNVVSGVRKTARRAK